MKKVFIGAFALTALWSVPAMAADMAVKAPPLPQPAQQSWTGFYVGGSVGAVWDRIGGHFDPQFSVWTTAQSTGTLGAFVGAQYQFSNNVVLGVEGDYTNIFRDNVTLLTPGGDALSGRVKEMWSVGGRAGWSMDTWLPYVSAGWASARVYMSDTFFAVAPPLFGLASVSSNTTHGGTYIGGGWDWRLWRNLIAGVEYRHYQFVNTTDTLPGFGVWTLKPHVDTVSLRLSLLFNGAMPSK